MILKDISFVKLILGTFCETSLITTTTASTTIATNTIVEECPAGSTICKNGGQCLLLNRNSIICACSQGYSGIKKTKLHLEVNQINYILWKVHFVKYLWFRQLPSQLLQ